LSLFATIGSLPPFSAATYFSFATALMLYFPFGNLTVLYDVVADVLLLIFSILIDEVLSFISSPTYDASLVNSFDFPLNPSSSYIVTLYPLLTLSDEI